jgi:hypothetical protein
MGLKRKIFLLIIPILHGTHRRLLKNAAFAHSDSGSKHDVLRQA